MIYNLLLGGLKVLKSGGVFYDIPLLFCHFMANLTTCWPMDYENKCLSLCKQKSFTTLQSKRWTAPSYLPLTISLLTASRMVYWTRCLLNNGHQLSTLLRVCCQREKMQIVSVCYREEKTHNREIAVGRRRFGVFKKNNYFFYPRDQITLCLN